ncbi:MAG: N-acetylglucosamine-6-phosphate deacetylase [Blautia sp.]|nr:N-acetylglucosamine-6-phosphate deacetylase [Blautia sp.]
MLIKNALVYGEDFQFRKGTIRIEDGIIADIGSEPVSVAGVGEEIVDTKGCYAIPGLIDIHFHGCMNVDLCDGTLEAVRTLARYELKAGVTAICPATLTLPVEELCRILSVAADFKKERDAHKADPAQEPMADLIGINMEGPFICQVKKGAQNGAYILPADASICEKFLEASEGLVKIIGLAPEENPDFEDYIRAVKDRVQVSLAHTNADYETALAAFRAGACHAVHLYNAMPSFTHRAPGVVGAVSDSPDVTAELICDGNHVHPSVVRATFQMLGDDRVVLISDSLRATGLGDGPMILGGQEVIVKGTRATLVDGGNLAGSVTNLADCLRIAVKEMGIPLESAVRAATANPAKVLNVSDTYGSLAPGKQGDVVLLDQELRVKAVIKKGILIEQ